jgi:trans-aconitate methyltransferase
MSIKSDSWNVNLYNKKHNFVYEYGEDLLKYLDPKEGEHILDLGCGTGQLTYQISKYKSIVTGIDSSKKMIESAKINYPEINFIVKDAISFNFDTPFDAIF